jgi:fumarate hydratase class II
VVTPLNKYIGYENAAKVAKTALRRGEDHQAGRREMGFVEQGRLTAEQLARRARRRLDDLP